MTSSLSIPLNPFKKFLAGAFSGILITTSTATSTLALQTTSYASGINIASNINHIVDERKSWNDFKAFLSNQLKTPHNTPEILHAIRTVGSKHKDEKGNDALMLFLSTEKNFISSELMTIALLTLVQEGDMRNRNNEGVSALEMLLKDPCKVHEDVREFILNDMVERTKTNTNMENGISKSLGIALNAEFDLHKNPGTVPQSTLKKLILKEENPIFAIVVASSCYYYLSFNDRSQEAEYYGLQDFLMEDVLPDVLARKDIKKLMNATMEKLVTDHQDNEDYSKTFMDIETEYKLTATRRDAISESVRRMIKEKEGS